MTAVVLTGVHLCACGAVVNADRWAALEVDGEPVCHRCGPAVWVDR